jgi:hypothetical protein
MTAVRQNRAASPTPGDFQNAIAISTTPTVGAVDSVSPVTQSLAQIISGAAGIVSDLGRDAELRRFREGQRAREIAAFNEQQRQDYEKAQKDARELAEKEFLGAGEQTLAVQVQLFQEQAGAAQPTQQMAALLSDVPDAQLEQELVPIVNGYIPEGVPENVRSQLVRKFVPQFATAIAPKRTEVRKNDQLRSADEIGFYNTNPDVSAQEALQSISLLRSKGPFATDAELFTRAYINPAKAAAEVGDVARVTEFYQQAPAEYKADLLPLIDQARASQLRINNDQVRTIKDAIARSKVLFDASGEQQFSPRSQLAFLDTAIVQYPNLAGELSETRESIRSQIERDAEKYQREATKRNDELSIAQQREFVQQAANDAVIVGDRGFFSQDQEIVRESTGEVSERLTGNDLLRDSMRRYFATVDSNEQFDPQTRTRLKLEQSRKLAYVDNTWAQEHSAGFRAISQASVQNVGGQFTVPEVTRSAARLHLAMRDTYPNAIQLNGDERLFYDRVVANMLNPAVGGSEQALDAAIAKAATDSFNPIDATLSDQVKEIGLQLAQEASILPNILFSTVNALPFVELSPTSAISTNFSNQGTLTQAAARRVAELRLANHPDPEREAERDLRSRLLNVKGFGFIMERPIPPVGNREPAELLEEQIDSLVEQYASVNLNEKGKPLKDTDVMTVQDPVTGFIRFFDRRTNSLVRTGSDDTGNDRFVAPLTVDELVRRATNKDSQAIAASTRLAAQRKLQSQQEEQLAKMAEKARGNSESSRELYYRRGY